MGKTSASVKNRYAAKNYDRINLQVRKGRKDELQAHASGRGESLNGFVNRAIDEAVERDIVAAPPVESAPPPPKKPTTYAERRAYQGSIKPAAYQDYLGGMTARDIATKYDVSVKAVAAWIGHWKGVPGGIVPGADVASE